jgi:hypothetical protein
VAAVSRPEVDGEAVVARRQRVESADVDVVEATASVHADHAASLNGMDAFSTACGGIRRPLRLASPAIGRRDALSLTAGAFAVIGLILLAVGILVGQVFVLLAGVTTLACGTGTLAGQRRRARARV